MKDIISRYGPIEDINLVHDHQTGRSRGFAFVYMRNLEDAVEVFNYLYIRIGPEKRFQAELGIPLSCYHYDTHSL